MAERDHEVTGEKSSALTDRVNAARSRVMAEHVFFGSFVHGLKTRLSLGVPAAATNGKEVVFNPDFLLSLDQEKVYGLLLHEICHVALGHHLRRGTRNHKWWNVACDYAINSVLTECGFEIPECGLFDPSYSGWSAEKIYVFFLQLRSGSPGESEIEQGQQGEVSDAPTRENPPNREDRRFSADEYPDDLPSLEEARARWAVQVSQAEALAAGVGKEIPSALRAELGQLKRSRVNWTAYLHDALVRVNEDDFSYAKPNKLFSNSTIIHPGPYNPVIGSLAIAVDTSGSTWPFLEKLMAEAKGVVESLNFSFSEIHLLECDEVLRSARVYRNGEDFTEDLRQVSGGRGTDVLPVLKHIEDEEIDVACLIYLTDLDFWRFPKTVPPYKVIWGAINASKRYRDRVPFGEVIDIDYYQS